MSTTTPNLGLFKYDPSTDGAQTFNIQKALNENWDKVDAAVKALSSAAEYSAAQTYALGDYCTHDGKLYRCTTAITEAEAWNQDHWTETSVTAELIAIYIALQNKAPASIAAYSDISIRVTDGKSIQEAIDSIPQNLNGHGVYVDVYGSHAEDVQISGFSGYSYFAIRLLDGASLTGSIAVYGPGKITITNNGDGTSTITNTSGGECISSHGGGVVECSHLSMTTTGAIVANADYSSRLTLITCKVKATGSGNYEAAIEAQNASEILANNVTIESGTVCGLCATYTSLIRFKGTNNATTKSATYSGGEVVTLS